MSKEHIIKFLNDTYDARHLSEKCRDYKDHKQWTAEEQQNLARRHQKAITVNRIKSKVQGLKGLYISRRTDPKAYARTPYHEKASHSISDALRYVKDRTKFDYVRQEVADNFLVEGYGAAIITEDHKGDPKIESIPWDRFYFDTHSRRLDFKDAQYMGIMVWMTRQTFLKRDGWTKKKFEECMAQQGFEDDIFEDRPRFAGRETFINKEEDRVRIAQEYYFKDGVWREKWFCGDVVLNDEESPFLDEEGFPSNPIEAITCYIDRENQRFSECLYFLDLQDEINHRRSKFLAMLSNRQTQSRKGVIEDIGKMKRELAKPDGHVEYQGEPNDFGLIPTNDMAEGQFALMQSSMQEMDATSFNAELAGQRQGDLSGRTVEKLQAAGMLTTEELFFNLKGWEERVYTQAWHRILHNWNEERWVRVTDDYEQLRYVGFNIKITLGQRLQEITQDETLPQEQRMQAQLVLQQMTQAQDQRLMQPVDVQNPVSELEMDIIIEHAPDTINVQQEQLQMLAEVISAGAEPMTLKWFFELSQLRDKEKYINEINQMIQAQQQAQQAAQQAADQRENVKTQVDAQKKAAETESIQIDNITEKLKQVVLASNPPSEITANV